MDTGQLKYISFLYLLKTTAPMQERMTTTSQKNFLRGAKFSRPASKREVQDAFWRIGHTNNICFGDLRYCKGKAILRRRKQLFRNHGCPSPMKYHPLRLVSWVNSTQCSFTPILKMPSQLINNVNNLEKDLKASRRVARHSLQGGMWAPRHWWTSPFFPKLNM